MGILYKTIIKEIPFENSEPIEDCMFVSLDSYKWIPVDKPFDLKPEHYEDVKKLFAEKNGMKQMTMDISFLYMLASRSKEKLCIEEIK